MSARGRLSDEQGETLLELVFAIVILGVLVVGIGSGMAVSAKVSGLHRMQSEAGAYLHSYAEAVQGTYSACSSTPAASAAAYVAALPRASDGRPVRPSGFASPTAVIKFWKANPGTFVDAGGVCPADPGLQQITFKLASNDNLITESLSVIVRQS